MLAKREIHYWNKLGICSMPWRKLDGGGKEMQASFATLNTLKSTETSEQKLNHSEWMHDCKFTIISDTRRQVFFPSFLFFIFRPFIHSHALHKAHFSAKILGKSFISTSIFH